MSPLKRSLSSLQHVPGVTFLLALSSGTALLLPFVRRPRPRPLLNIKIYWENIYFLSKLSKFPVVGEIIIGVPDFGPPPSVSDSPLSADPGTHRAAAPGLVPTSDPVPCCGFIPGVLQCRRTKRHRVLWLRKIRYRETRIYLPGF